MEQHISDFLVHIHEALSPEEQCELEDFVRRQPCVVGAGVSQKDPHLMTVAYDSECGTAHSILTRVREKVTGAEMIGL
ncbi:MAG: hypothetical protein AB1591_11835 [Pseudomonadota bacterium]